MTELSHDEVVEVLGRRLSDVIIAEIIATGITKDELAAARERVLSDRKAHNPGPPLEPGAFAQVVDILERSPGRGILGHAGIAPGHNSRRAGIRFGAKLGLPIRSQQL